MNPQRLVARPGDILILQTDEHVPLDTMKAWRDHVEDRFPGVKALVLSGVRVGGIVSRRSNHRVAGLRRRMK